MMEIWKTIPRWPEYEASSAGRIRRALPSASPKGRVKIGRMLKLTLRSDGYLSVRLKRPGLGRTEKVHVLICETFHGEKPTLAHEVNHRNSDRADCRSGNVEWMTRPENLEHARTYGAGNVEGERNPAAKLTIEQVDAIRTDKRSQRLIADDYGISQQNVSLIKSGKAW